MTVGIVGLGLIGGSLTKAYKEAGHRVLVWNRTESVADFAILSGDADGKLAESTVGQCDLIHLSLYPEASADWLIKRAHLVSKNCLVIDD